MMAGHARNVRDATSDDVATIVDIVERSYAKYVPRMGRRPAPMDHDYAQSVADGTVTVIEAGGSIVAAMVAWPDGESYCIDILAVDPDAQGGGIGIALIDLATERARTAGCRRLSLYTNAMMTENLDYYPRRGFTETKREERNGFHRVFFEREL